MAFSHRHVFSTIFILLLDVTYLVADISSNDREQETDDTALSQTEQGAQQNEKIKFELYPSSNIGKFHLNKRDVKGEYADEKTYENDAYVKMLYEEGKRAFNKGDYDGAMVYFEELLSIEPDDVEAHRYLTKIKERNSGGVQEERDVEGEEIEKIKKEIESLRMELAAGSYRYGSNETYKAGAHKKEMAVESALLEARRREEEMKRFLKRKAEEERQLRQAEERARLETKRRIQRLAQDQYALGLEFYKEGSYKRAIEELQKLRDIDPLSEYALLANKYIRYAQERLGISQVASGHPERPGPGQAKEMGRALKVAGGVPSSEETRSKVLKGLLREAKLAFSERNYDVAIARYKAILEIEPTNVAAEELLDRAINAKIANEQEKAEKKIDIDEKKMMSEVADKWVLPDEKISPPAETKVKDIEASESGFLRPNAIKKKLAQPITVDFRDVALSYVFNYLSDVTEANIIASDAVYSIDKKVTLRMKDMPLEDAIRYITKNQGLSYRIEDEAVVVITPDELEGEKVETRVYFLTKGTGLFTEFSESSTGVSKGLGQAGDVKKITTLKDILEEAVPFPKDSKIVMDERTGAIIIANTPSNLKKVEEILNHLNVTPLQLLIEARFLDVDVTDLQDIGIEEKLNSPWDVHKRNVELRWLGPGVGGPVTQIASDGGVDFTAFSRTDGFNLTYQGVLTKPQYQMVLHALEERSTVKTLSCPQVTTLNNETATIKVVDEFIYPTKYEVSLIQFDINGDGDYDDAGETEFANVPQNFITRDVGIVLKVTPSVGADKKTISLTLIPEVSTGTAGAYTYSGGVTLPKFTSRSLATSVVVNEGDTVILGGLIKDTTTDTLTKVPILGDLPAIGRLFQKRHKSVERRNLLIFVTANIISSHNELQMANIEKIE